MTKPTNEPGSSPPSESPRRRFGRESLKAKSERAVQILDRLEAEYPNAKIALDFSNPLELLIATILAAQARDSHINTVTPALFQKYKTAADWASAPLDVLRQELRSTGTFNQKAKSVHEATQGLVEHHGGQVPDDLEALTRLHGVGRKTANVVVGNAFGHPDRIAVDTHVKRLSQRLGFTRQDDPEKIEVESSACGRRPVGLAPATCFSSTAAGSAMRRSPGAKPAS